ncbi:hypothetical protein ACTWJ8_24950 [Streptomyces sp. SDT5-1]|uniref:hypothetical protein n=1 Tax=Streptomyces sp. SDT5-1 TaxID=3406418 RepID=UPI003FD00F44
MSRETDSSSSGPQGRGAAAYPSGTPPYGSPAQGDAGPTPPGEQSAPEGPKTETTLTTRIRINIPGSRPIPPVVMRTPMSDVDGKAEAAADQGADATPAAPAPGPDATRGGARPSAPSGFGSGGGTGSGPAAPEASAPAAPAPAAPQREEKTSDWFAPRKPRGGGAGGPATGAVPTAGSGGPGGASGPGGPGGPAAGGPTPPSGPNAGAPSGTSGGPLGGPSAGGPAGPTGGPTGGSSGGFDVSGAIAAGPLGSGGGPRDDLPFFAANQDSGAPRPGEGPNGPVGPTAGPAAGDGPMTPPSAPNPQVPGAGRSGPGGTPPRMSDDTAILTPQKPAPEPPGNRDNVSGDTLTSGMPVVGGSGGGPKRPGPSGDPFQQGPDSPAAVHTPPKLPDPVPAEPAPAKKKGRNKLVLVGAGVVVLAGVAYGAGLLMNHSDVPKGTTVAGVDIGGGTRDEATSKLENALGKRTEQPLKLEVNGKTVRLAPEQAGLSFDTASTVAAAAGSDYNPVSVIGSLFGNERVVAPVMPVDEEKLAAALERAAGGAAASGDGTIKFEPGKAVPVYGKTGKGLDVAQSAAAVKDAYHAQIETGASGTVPLATSTHKPTISDAEVDRKMQQFAEPAMSGLVTVKAGNASIQFGPDKSLPKILGVKAVNGKLVETYNLPVLKKLYGTTFDGVTVTRGTGKKTPVQPTDVAAAIGKALLGKTPAERTAEIQTS